MVGKKKRKCNIDDFQELIENDKYKLSNFNSYLPEKYSLQRTFYRVHPSKLTYYAEMLKRIQSVITNLQAHLPIEFLPPLEDSHQQVYHTRLNEFVTT